MHLSYGIIETMSNLLAAAAGCKTVYDGDFDLAILTATPVLMLATGVARGYFKTFQWDDPKRLQKVYAARRRFKHAINRFLLRVLAGFIVLAPAAIMGQALHDLAAQSEPQVARSIMKYTFYVVVAFYGAAVLVYLLPSIPTKEEVDAAHKEMEQKLQAERDRTNSVDQPLFPK